MDEAIYNHLAFLYGDGQAPKIYQRLDIILSRFRRRHPHLGDPPATRVTERDAVLITYGDMVRSEEAPPLRSLSEFLTKYAAGVVSTVHLLPFYPYSSDDGFSVVDYKAVNPELGSWADVSAIGRRFRLMFDAVINHISAKSVWFRGFLRDEAQYRNYFLVVEPGTDLSQVFRPRALPLLTPVTTAAGEKLVWTTFSSDQIDLNYACPDVLLSIIETLLFYVNKGAEFIRLDAIAYLWKEIGTPCIHLPQTHHVIQLFRAVLDAVAPGVVVITETNVPHEENVSYFGDGHNEAQMVYNFSLPPLTLHTFHTGDATALSGWADSLTLPSDQVTFFNFLASHDGIGVTPARGILSDAAVHDMVERVQALGGFVSYRSQPDGSQSVYELNINYLDALGDPDFPHSPVALIAQRFLASQAIMLALRGVPGIYFHSLFGSRGWPEGVQHSGRRRTINRQKLHRSQLEQELDDSLSLRRHVFSGYANLLRQRTTHAAFHPQGEQRVLFICESVFALQRRSPDGRSAVLCLHNVSSQPHRLKLNLKGAFSNLLDGAKYQSTGDILSLVIKPYGILWLEKEP
ncbi:MAG: sugar phosphorylase [Anaerolineae bacterium]